MKPLTLFVFLVFTVPAMAVDLPLLCKDSAIHLVQETLKKSYPGSGQFKFLRIDVVDPQKPEIKVVFDHLLKGNESLCYHSEVRLRMKVSADQKHCRPITQSPVIALGDCRQEP